MQKMILRKGHRLRPGGAYPKTTITIHSTANANSTALNERAWLDNPTNNRYASWHYCVDESGVVQAYRTGKRHGTAVTPEETAIHFP